MNAEVFASLTARNREVRTLKAAIKEKDTAIGRIMTERRKEAGMFCRILIQ